MTEEGAALDAGDPKHHLFWCKKCEAPVRSSAWRGHVTIACAACGFEEERDILLSKARPEELAPPALYRDPAPDRTPWLKVLKVDVNTAPSGHDVNALDAAKLRAAFAKKSKVPEGRKALEWEGACEWEGTWIAVWLALHQVLAGDPLSARIALETALDGTSTPEYRALLLAQLSQHASSQKAARLAKRWLAACPHVDIPEVESEVRAARAMLALLRGDLWKVIDLTGGNTAGQGYVGTSVFLAIALNVEACDRRGDYVVADAIMREVRKQHVMPSMLLWISAFDLAKGGLQRMNRWVQKRDAAFATGVVALALTLVAAIAGRMDLGNAALLVAAGAALTYATCWASFPRRAFTRWGKPFRIGTTAAIASAIFGASSILLTR